MQTSICINAEINQYQTALFEAPIHKNEEGKVWLLVDYDECDWHHEIEQDYICGEEGGVEFKQPFQTLGYCEGYWEGYRILNAEEIISNKLGFV